mmetsp:Transcript_20111/g.48217  ORF Transcript_20111/g.48217 Transcript_20111/m.48217 type:complete len:210 (+) Transcript_20111:487-1116(+)
MKDLSCAASRFFSSGYFRGLLAKAVKPSDLHLKRVSEHSSAVSAMIGTWLASSSRIRCVVSNPSITGMRRSINTSEYKFKLFFIIWSASAPSSARSLVQPSLESIPCRHMAHMSVSSTISTCGACIAWRPFFAMTSANEHICSADGVRFLKVPPSDSDMLVKLASAGSGLSRRDNMLDKFRWVYSLPSNGSHIVTGITNQNWDPVEEDW